MFDHAVYGWRRHLAEFCIEASKPWRGPAAAFEGPLTASTNWSLSDADREVINFTFSESLGMLRPTVLHHKMILIESYQFVLVMSMKVSQSQIVKLPEVSEMTLSRTVQALGRENRPISPCDKVRLFLDAKLQLPAGLSPRAASAFIAEFHHETMFDAKGEEQCVWFVSIRCGGKEMQVAAMSVAHLTGLMDAHPAGAIIPLLALVDCARDRPKALKSGKVAA